MQQTQNEHVKQNPEKARLKTPKHFNGNWHASLKRSKERKLQVEGLGGGRREASYGVGADGLHSPAQSQSSSSTLPPSCQTATSTSTSTSTSNGNGTFDARRDAGFIHEQAGERMRRGGGDPPVATVQ